MLPTNLSSRRARWSLAAGAFVLAGALLGPGFARSYGPWADDGGGGSSSAAASISAGDPSGTAKSIAGLELKARDSDDPDTHLALANAYLQRIRETSDPSLYALAERSLERARVLDPNDPEITFVRGTLSLARHDFREALGLGESAIAADPERARYHGLVADAQMELGMYGEAVDSLQRMVDLRPDFASYSRIAYARELHGDIEGAIESMEQAIVAGAPYPENVAWAHVQNGNLRFALGDLAGAEKDYATALQSLDGYAGATAGHGRLAAADGDLDRAAKLYQEAFDRQPLAEYAIALGDIALRAGDKSAAERADGLVRAVDQLARSNGVDTELEYAIFLADRGDTVGAVTRARSAYEARPNIHAADALAWALYRSGDHAGADKFSQEALRLGSRDPLKLFHAGLIAKANGRAAEAREHLELVINLNARFSVLHEEEAMRTLTELRASVLAR